MPKGGARARAGRPESEEAFRRDRVAGEWLELPVTGREGEPPEWPLDGESAREHALWVEQWRRPQAIVWERNGQHVEVAMFVRALTEAETLRASVSSRTLVKQQMDTLGLTVPGLRANRWKIVDAPSAQAPKAQPRSRSARSRLKVVQGGAKSSGDDGGST